MCPQAKQALGKQSDTAFTAGAASLQVNVSNGVFGRGEIGTQTDQVRATQPAACRAACILDSSGLPDAVYTAAAPACATAVWPAVGIERATVYGLCAVGLPQRSSIPTQCCCSARAPAFLVGASRSGRPSCCHCSQTMSIEAPCETAAAKHLQVNKAGDDLKETAANPVQSAKNVSRFGPAECFR